MRIQEFYRSHGVMTDPGAFSQMYSELPPNISDLVKAVQGSLIHVFWAERYGIKLSDQQKATLQIRRIDRKLEILANKSNASLSDPRPLDQRQVGNCRDFSTLLCSMLRQKGVPARARCGFSTYLLPGHYEDHWVCEYWSNEKMRWIMVDPQLDDFQKQAMSIVFDPLDVPRDQFVTGGQAWDTCRSGKADPKDFGILNMSGLGFIWGNVIRDILALSKTEILPWDSGWGYLAYHLEAPLPTETLNLFDEIATLTLDPEKNFDEIQRRCTRDPLLRIPNELLR